MPPEFAAELDKLQPGEVSQPFKTRFGWHIVQLVERRQSQDSEETQRDKIREALFKRRVDEEWDMRLRRLRDEAYVEIRLPKASTEQ
jgi:peptidyl-prolyl cis-trans isomerase SurA